MPMINLASKYSKQVDERFYRESQAMLALSNEHQFTGVQTVKVYSIPIVPMSDYQRSGANRYGSANDLTRNVQELTITKDRAWTFIIDRGDKLQSELTDYDRLCAAGIPVPKLLGVDRAGERILKAYVQVVNFAT